MKNKWILPEGRIRFGQQTANQERYVAQPPSRA